VCILAMAFDPGCCLRHSTPAEGFRDHAQQAFNPPNRQAVQHLQWLDAVQEHRKHSQPVLPHAEFLIRKINYDGCNALHNKKAEKKAWKLSGCNAGHKKCAKTCLEARKLRHARRHFRETVCVQIEHCDGCRNNTTFNGNVNLR
jgi:hypothetical protein